MPERKAWRRRAPRFHVALEGTLSGRGERPVTILDLSETGCLVRCAASLEPGSIHDLGSALAGVAFAAKVRVAETSLDGSASPAEERRHLVGLEFLALAARDEAALREFLGGRLRPGAGPP